MTNKKQTKKVTTKSATPAVKTPRVTIKSLTEDNDKLRDEYVQLNNENIQIKETLNTAMNKLAAMQAELDAAREALRFLEFTEEQAQKNKPMLVKWAEKVSGVKKEIQ